MYALQTYEVRKNLADLPLNGQFQLLLSDVKCLLMAAGVYSDPPARKVTIERMNNLTDFELDKLIAQLEIMKKLYSAPVGSGDVFNNEKWSEKSLLKRALSFWGLEGKGDFLNNISDTDVIELYDKSAVQLYRSLNFFKTSSYSLEDLIVNEWFNLWERPKYVMDSLLSTMSDLLSGEVALTKFDTPEHLIKEVFQDEEHKKYQRLLKVKLSLGIPLCIIGTNHIDGFLVASSCEVCAEGHQTNSVAIL